MLDSNQTLNIIINPGKLLPAQKFSKEWTIFYLYSYKAQNKRWLAGRQAGRRSPHPGFGISGTLLNHPHTVQFYTNVSFWACQVIAHSHDASCWDNPPFQLSILTNWSSFSSSADWSGSFSFCWHWLHQRKKGLWFAAAAIVVIWGNGLAAAAINVIVL